MLWQATSHGRVYDAGEGPVVYFDPRSGDTHLLTAFSAYVAGLLTGQAMSAAELEQALKPMVDEEDSAHLEQTIAGVLEELRTLDIVRPA